ncbi:MAG: NAD(P)/FAD-dependent oxidoreductase [Xanthobacteraceae bacterium]
MARTDAVVLGAGIVGTSIALHLVKRGLSVALVDRREPGQETSYGNTGVIGSTALPAAFPRSLGRLVRAALKRSLEVNYHLSSLPRVLPWLRAFRAASAPERRAETARLMRPLMAQAVSEHEALMAESGARRYLRKDGLLTLYRSERALAELWTELALAAQLGVAIKFHDAEGARELEPDLAPVFKAAVHWPDVASLTDPYGVTRAYAARFAALGGVVLRGDARSLHRAAGRWRVDTSEGPIDADDAVMALGPWAPDLLLSRGIDLPLAVKRGYHRHFAIRDGAKLGRPVVDIENGFAIAPMKQGIRVTTGAEFADRDAPATPVQLRRVLPIAKALVPLGEPVDARPWMGSRPCFADSRPVIGRAPGHPGLWLAYGHGHVGLSLGPVTGRLIAEMITGEVPFCDPAPYAAERFGKRPMANRA